MFSKLVHVVGMRGGPLSPNPGPFTASHYVHVTLQVTPPTNVQGDCINTIRQYLPCSQCAARRKGIITAKMRTKIEQAKPEVISPTRERRQFGSHVSKREEVTI